MSTEIPPAGPGRDAGAAVKLQILATEHWSLLATRQLTYNEAFSRVTIFLSILSGALIALALVAQADHFGPTFNAIAIPMLLVVMFVGITTVSRLTALNRDDYRWVIGMNRLRHGYVDLHPEIEQYLITSPHDDLWGALQTLGIDDVTAPRRLGSLIHIPQTLPAIISVLVAAVGGAIAALIALATVAPALAIGAAAAVAFVVVLLVMGAWNRRSIKNSPPSLAPRFPSPHPG
jgi:hypothetical protein